MSAAQFDALVYDLQVLSASKPGVYRLRVAFFASLGYGVLVGTVAVLLLSIAAIVYLLFTVRGGALALKLIVPLAALLFVVLRSLWVTIDAPAGIPITPERAPALFAMLEDVRAQVNGPTIHHVYLNELLNASIYQVPRFGVFGWPENYVVIGLPLMLLLPVTEFRAVMAHEMGHLVGSHGFFGNWVYQQRQTWARLLQGLEAEQKPGGKFFTNFLRWYDPVFSAHTAVMMRRHEFDADALAAEVAGPRIAADALLRLQFLDLRLNQEYWTGMQYGARSNPLPLANGISQMSAWNRRTTSPAHLEDVLATALRLETASTDTHPSLKARLEALGEDPRIPEPIDVSAAEQLFGAELQDVEGEIDRRWYISMVEPWKQLYATAQEERKCLGELEAQQATAPLSTEQQWERACLLSKDHRFADSEALVEQLVATVPDFAPARSSWGIILLERNDEQGLAHIDRALELGLLDPRPAAQAAFNYLKSRGRADEAAHYATIMQDYESILTAARAEREGFVHTDAIEPHGLADSDIALLARMLQQVPEVESATLVRKRMEYFPESPIFVLAVRMRPGRFGQTFWGNREEKVKEVRQAVLNAVKMKPEWFCLSLDLLTGAEAAAFEAAAGEPSYRAAAA